MMQKAYDNLLEPAGLADLFLRHPPEGFATGTLARGTPFFRTDFDLSGILGKNTLSRLKKLPLYRRWSALLRVRACFAGTTVTEYALLPKNAGPAVVLAELEAAAGNDDLVIVKDLPAASPLLSPEENAAADAFARAAGERKFLTLHGQALAYVPVDFAGIDDYLGRLSAARRKDMRRKLKQRHALEIEELPLGHPVFSRPAELDAFFAAYLEVFAQSHIHFDLLTRDYFAGLLRSRDIRGVVFRYRQDGRLIGQNVCLIHEGRLIDKHIGFRYPEARHANLYFISWFHNLRYAVDNGLRVYIAGWTDPEVKAALGARFTFTRHLFKIRNPVLRVLAAPFKRFFEGDRKTLEAAS